MAWEGSKGSWLESNGLPSQRLLVSLRGGLTTSELKKGPNYWAAVKKIGQWAKARSDDVERMSEGHFIVKSVLCGELKLIVPHRITVPANFVPAAAVKRGGQVLFTIIGRKGQVDGFSRF